MLTYIAIFIPTYVGLLNSVPLLNSYYYMQDIVPQLIRHTIIFYLTWQITNFIWRQKWIPKQRLSPEKKAVAITGCDTGFGNLLARRLDAAGYKVFAFCLKPEDSDALKLKRECSDKLKVIEMDVTNYETINKAFEIVECDLITSGCKLMALVNNAGILSLGEVEFGATIESFERQMDVNCLGVIRVTKAFCPLLRRCENSRLVNVTSLAARISLPGMVGYCVSKCAALSFTDGIRIELMKWGIQVVSVEPHLFRTNLIGHQQKMFNNLWYSSRPITRQDYGNEFFEGAKRLLDRGTDSARSNIPDVIDALYDSVTVKYPETHKKVCSSEFERIRVWFLIYVIPRFLQDYLLYRGALYITGKPAMLTQRRSMSTKI